jgi:hypothetical protein
MSEIEKNTVESKNQLDVNRYVTYENENGSGLRFMFVGNSITLHGPKSDIGWSGNWGMAASSKEKDYVHILIRKIQAVTPDPSFCICQAAEWERNYINGKSVYNFYQKARDYKPNVIIMRIVENCPALKPGDFEIFKKEYADFLDYLKSDTDAKVILTTGFWRHSADDAIREIARDLNFELCELGDLGEKSEMRADGLFEHSGVAHHPGDKGMQAIAERIFEKLF